MVTLACDLDFFGSGIAAEVTTVFLAFFDRALARLVRAGLFFLIRHSGLLFARTARHCAGCRKLNGNPHLMSR